MGGFSESTTACNRSNQLYFYYIHYKDIHEPLQPEDQLIAISSTHTPDREYPHCHTRSSQFGVLAAQDLDSLQASSKTTSL